jgi:hypothetical protein
MSDNDSTEFIDETSSICELHHVQMVRAKVPILYGLIRLNDYGKALRAARETSFPHAQDCVLGGCVIGSPDRAVIYHCPECRKAKRAWEVNHPPPTDP